MADQQHVDARPFTGAGIPLSNQRVWFPCHEFVAALKAQAGIGNLPAAGTPAWLALADSDPQEALLALAEAGVHHVLRIDTEQEQRADASHDIASAADWSALAQRIAQGRGDNYISRRKEIA